jgi:hypothetical protein
MVATGSGWVPFGLALATPPGISGVTFLEILLFNALLASGKFSEIQFPTFLAGHLSAEEECVSWSTELCSGQPNP